MTLYDPPIAQRIRDVRRALRESTMAFGRRFARSPRSVEAWEQGRRCPDPLVLAQVADLERWAYRNRRKKRGPS